MGIGKNNDCISGKTFIVLHSHCRGPYLYGTTAIDVDHLTGDDRDFVF